MRKRRIYVASSWRNKHQPGVVSALREAGHEVYDFRNPAPGVPGFSWDEIDANWRSWTPEQYLEALKHPAAEAGFKRDRDAMQWADTCVLILPSGRSANLEAGWFAGRAAEHFDNGWKLQNKRRMRELHVYIAEYDDPDLMYLEANSISTSMEQLLAELAR